MPIYKIADLFVQMNPLYEPLLSQSKPYLYLEDIDVIDCIIPQGEEVIKKFQVKNPHLTIGECEYALYGSYFYNALVDNKGIMLHSSAVVYKDKAYLFSAPSGTGKSTHTSIWLKVFDGSKILNDDKPALRIIEDKIIAYGTPFSGKTNQNLNMSFPVQGICFLERSEDNSIKEIKISKAIPLIFSQTILPHDEDKLDKMVESIEKIVMNVKIFILGCNMEESAAEISYKSMNN